MEAAATLPSFHWITPHVGSTRAKACLTPMFGVSSNKSLLPQGLSAGGQLVCSPVKRKISLLTYAKVSEAELASSSNSNSLKEGPIPVGAAVPSDKSSEQPVEKETLQSTPFPAGFEALILEVCDETEVAELKVKVGNFEMHMKRNVGASIVTSPPIASPTTPPPVPSKPMVESGAPAVSPTPPKPSPTAANPFANVSLSKAAKLASLESSGSSNYVLVSSPTVGSFRRGRTVKGKKQPPICKEGDIIKEGQVIGYLDQFGSELPVKSDMTGEVLKLLYKDGEAVGYGDPLVAVLPSFHGIK